MRWYAPGASRSVCSGTGNVVAWIAVVSIVVCLPLAARVNADSTPEGYWHSDGYGLVVEVAGNEWTVFETTDISCIRQARFRLNSLGENRWFVADQSDPDDAAIAIRRDSGPPERLYVQRAGMASEIVFERSDKLPAVCAETVPNDPLHNFDVFWQTFSEHYPFFKLKGIDWQARRKRYRAALNQESSDRELFDALVKLVEPLEDLHVRIEGPESVGSYQGVRSDAYDTDDAEAFFARAATAEAILEKSYVIGPLRQYARDNVRFGRLPGDVGFLRITSFDDFGKGSFQDQQEQFERDLDEIFREPMKGLVIDLRLNLGGSDVLGQAIAARLATKPYVAYRKVARNDRRDDAAWTTPQPNLIRPKRPGFAGPVVVLTSRGTISAGETFTQALMGREPTVVRIGQNTQGVFSDVLRRRLPNGWRFGLPNEIFLDERGRYYDGVGIAPHHRVAVFENADLEAGKDPAVDKALEVIKSSQR